jgi:hypothetical protein
MTAIVNGVEYDKFPPPSVLWRATRDSYAQDTIQKGLIYFTNANEFRMDINHERGDLTETDGNFIRQGVPCATGHTNPIFLFCTTFESNADAVLALWRDYDTVICIHNPQMLAERMLKAAINQGVKIISFHAGSPSYDKYRGGTNPYHWAESIYQKPEKYMPQKEYRFAIVGDYSLISTKQIILNIGSCEDFISITANNAI